MQTLQTLPSQLHWQCYRPPKHFCSILQSPGENSLNHTLSFQIPAENAEIAVVFKQIASFCNCQQQKYGCYPSCFNSHHAACRRHLLFGHAIYRLPSRHSILFLSMFNTSGHLQATWASRSCQIVIEWQLPTRLWLLQPLN